MGACLSMMDVISFKYFDTYHLCFDFHVGSQFGSGGLFEIA